MKERSLSTIWRGYSQPIRIPYCVMDKRLCSLLKTHASLRGTRCRCSLERWQRRMLSLVNSNWQFEQRSRPETSHLRWAIMISAPKTKGCSRFTGPDKHFMESNHEWQWIVSFWNLALETPARSLAQVVPVRDCRLEGCPWPRYRRNTALLVGL